MEIRNKKKSLSVGIIINVIAFVVVRSLSIFTAPITTRILSTNDYGILSIFNTWSGLIGIIAGLGIQGSLTVFRVKSQEKDYYHYCWNILIIGIVSHLVFFLLILPFKSIISQLIGIPEKLIYLIIFSAMFQFCTSLLSTFFIIENMALYNAIFSFITVVGAFCLSILLVYQHNYDSELYIPFILGSFFINCALGIFSVIYFCIKGFGRIQKDYIKYSLIIGFPLIFHSISGLILSSSDRVMIQHMDDISTAGVYSFTYGFACILSSVWSAINSIWSPYYCKYLKENNTKDLFEKKRNFDFLFLMLTLGFLFVYPEVFRFLANERYWTQIKIIPILLIGFFAQHMYSFPTNYELYKENTKYVAYGSIAAAVLNVILNLILIPRFNVVGAAIATSLSYIGLFIFHLFIAKKIIGDYPYKNALSIIYYIFLLAGLLGFYIFYNLWIVRWGLAALVGIFLIKDIVKRKSIL